MYSKSWYDNQVRNMNEKINGCADRMAKRVADVRGSAEFAAWMRQLQTGHAYSFGNSLLIAIQKPNATRVMSKKAWGQVGRTVLETEKSNGAMILVPYFIGGKKDKSDENETEKRIPMRFGVGYVYDISQTEGAELPTMKWMAMETRPEVRDALVAFCKRENIAVDFVDELGSAGGVSMGGRVQVLESAGDMVLAHEIAHELLHQKNNKDKSISREQKEWEAELTAAAVGAIFGYEDETAVNYLANWNATPEDLKNAMARISSVVTKIAKAVGSAE